MMPADVAVQLIETLEDAGVGVWVDGGWGVYALVQSQTRTHDDLDLVIDIDDVDAAVEALAGAGFEMSEDERPTRFVMRGTDDRRIDFHPLAFDADGSGVQTLPGNRHYRYSAAGLAGEGTIGARRVRCLSPEEQVLCHLGYTPTDTDRHDVALLAEHFDIALPAAYR